MSPLATRSRRLPGSRAVLAVAVLGCFMAFVDATIVNIAVPNIAEHFSGSRLSSISWVLNAYNIVFAAFLVGGGQLADLLGRRRVFMLALVLFTLASALCAVAPSLNFLIAARVVQAAGSAALVPSSLAIVLEAHDQRERMHAVALWTAVAALAAGIGPPLGGLLITASSWRLVFLVNIPVGILALALARRVIVESRAPGRRRLPDLLGGGVLALAIASLVLAVVKGQEWGWGSARVVGALIAAVLLGAYFVLRSSRHRTPVVDLSLMRIRGFALSNGVTLVGAGGFYAYTLCNVLFLTAVWRYSILQAGLALTPGPIVAIAIASPGSRLVERVGARLVAVPGALIWAGGVIYFATTLGSAPDFLGRWLPGMAILGIGAGLTFPTLSGAAVGSVPGPRFAIATSLNSVARQVGAALGVSILIAIIGQPSASGALHAFEHGWLFAAGCFVFCALACLGLVLARPQEAEQEPVGQGLAALTGEAPSELERPRKPLLALAEAEGEREASEPQTVAEFLRNVPIFAAVSERMLESLAALASSVRVARGEWLFRQGDPGDGVYVVAVGHLEVLRKEGALESESINTLTRGDVLGELALLSDSTRSASVRAIRDSELLKIDRDAFEALLRDEPELALSLTRVLSSQLQASRPIPPARRGRAVTIALVALDQGIPLIELADELSHAMSASGRIAVLLAPQQEGVEEQSSSEAFARFAPVIERCELDHDQVIMLCSAAPRSGAWEEFCIAHADRVVALVSGPMPERSEAAELHAQTAALRGADMIGYDVHAGSGELSGWISSLQPAAIYALSADGQRREEIARIARRLSGNSLGIVLAGGGARALAHLGVLEVLLDAGVRVDRVGGVSMGAFIGGLLACGADSAAIDACCFEEWVRRNPINDYTLPRAALIRGRKAEAMLERTFGDVRIEELSRSFYCASVNLRRSELVVDRLGPLMEAIGASISLPLIAPPLIRDQSLLIDGSLLDNLPLAPMSESGEGPVLAIDIKGGDPRRGIGIADEPESSASSARGTRMPSLPQTMARVALLSSANTGESVRRYADMAIEVRVSGVGLLEFHQIDEARAAGRSAALAALEHAPDWLLAGAAGPASSSRARTVLRV
jgi:EmrB/QacA subfamily drug resistance transporter